ncbi:MAG: EAL domain-containing protein [Actinomycetota bacterium]
MTTIRARHGNGAVRVHLTRHPVAQECARAAASLMGAARAEVVVFEADRVFVAASSVVTTAMFPRTPTAAELALIDASTPVLLGNDLAVPVRDSDGELVGSLTLEFDGDALDPDTAQFVDVDRRVDGLEALARLIAGALDADDDRDEEQVENFAARVLDGQRDAVVVLDADLTVTWASPGLVSLLGRSPAEAIGRSAAEFLHPDDIARTIDAITRISEGLALTRVVVRLATGHGTFIPIEVTGNDLSADPVVGGIVLSLRDAQHESELGAAADRAERISSSIIHGLRDGVIATDGVGAITIVNDVARELFDIDPAFRPSQLEIDDFALTTVDGQPHDPRTETPDDEQPPVCHLVSQRGAVRYLTTATEAVHDADGLEVGRVIIFSDVTREHVAAQELRRQALHDQLTGLPNRRLLEERLAEIASLTNSVNVAACFIDLDGFKLVNDNHGHRVGDEIVRIAAHRLSTQLRDGDLLVRQGGDEFVALLVGIDDLESAARSAERCRAALEDPFVVGSERFDLSGSVGVAMQRSEDLDGDILLQHADMALYAAKNGGRNRVEVFDAVLADIVSDQARQQRIVRDAIDDGRLRPHFQPLVDARTGQTIAYESLVRLETETGEILTAEEFLDAIASTSIMWDLDRVTFAWSCRAAVRFCELSPDDPPSVACNFSPVSITHPEFLTMLDDTIAEEGADPRQMTVELTESAAFESSRHGGVLEEVRRRGLRLSLDDFGTGYSSLAHLRDLPLNTVKIDRSFVVRLQEDRVERSITDAVVSLARELDVATVAEGVETAEQLEEVRTLGFDTVQGWYHSAAVPLEGALDDWRNTLAGRRQPPVVG